MLDGLLLVILPLACGYLFKLSNPNLLLTIDKMVRYLVIAILMVMGMGLAKMDQLASHIGQMFYLTGVLFVCVSAGNLLALPILDRLWRTESQTKSANLPLKEMLLSSGKLILAVVVGVCLGLLMKAWQPHWLFALDTASEVILILLLLLIGVSLRNSAMPIRQFLVNPKGIVLALVVAATALPGGLVAAYWLEISWGQGLALASGFGWYSLAGILITEQMGPVWGGAAFLNELLREMLAIMMIPLLIARYPATAVGFSGATAMDFALPVIQQSSGNQFVPLAIVSGFILSLFVPVFISFFLSF